MKARSLGWMTAAAFVLVASPVQAGLVTDSGLLVGSQIDDYHFSVTAAGLVDISVSETIPGNNGGFVFDTEINLFRDDGSLDLADFIRSDDDSGGGPSSFESRIITILGAGNYLLRVGNFDFGDSSGTDPVIIAATNPHAVASRQSDYTVSISGDFVDSPVAALPEPTALGLFGMGLAALGFANRRRRG